jgi:site-specific recombinase XerD
MTGHSIKKVLIQHGITPSSVTLRNEKVVSLQFKKDNDLNEVVKATGAKWSSTLQTWWMPHKKIILQKLALNLAEKSGYIFNGMTEVNELVRFLNLKSYSSSTIKNYKDAFVNFADHFDDRDLNTISKREVEDYLLYLRNKKLSETTIHGAINAIKFYYEQVLKKQKEFYQLQRPKKPIKNVTVFSENEVTKIISAISNIKHKAMLMIGYAAGLRISEIVNLKIKDIDSERMMLHIRNAKGKKDREVILSETLLLVLREYYKKYSPKDFLFEGQTGTQYSTRSLSLVMQQAKLKAGVKKEGSIHAFRHSFATHLLEGGTDITIIQKLLGHNDIKTTLRYTHVSNVMINKVKSPLDKLDFKNSKSAK